MTSIQEPALEAFAYLSDTHNEQRLLALAEGNSLQILLDVARKGYDQKLEGILTTAVRSIANLLTSETDVVERLIELGVLDFFHVILSSSIHASMQTEVLWALSNIACHSEESIKVLVKHPVFSVIIQALSVPRVTIMNEASTVISNTLTCISDPALIHEIISKYPTLLPEYFKGLDTTQAVNSEKKILFILETIEYLCKLDMQSQQLDNQNSFR